MERDYAAILHPVIDPLVENPGSIMIRELPGSTKRDVTIVIVAEDEDTARLIGKRGAVANAKSCPSQPALTIPINTSTSALNPSLKEPKKKPLNK